MAPRFPVICIFAVCLKLLFIPMYHSTDMEVHRNWMAITHNKFINDWYMEETSKWTLDYPPLFAWFEYLLSFPAKYFDSGMLNIQEKSYTSPNTLLFMRLSVIISDVVYILAVKRISESFWKGSLDKNCSDPWLRIDVIFSMLMLLNPGLLIVDHIHFQYNGFLFGFLLLSIAALKEEKYVECAFWYTLLINFKHLYICLAPAYFFYLLKNYCFTKQCFGWDLLQYFSIKNFLKLSVTVGTITAISFGPFIYMGQINQVLKRIFPVQRGLTHAYWAPNIWALYNALDIGLSFLAQKAGLKIHSNHSITRGLVQEYSHRILPSVGVKTTLFLVFIAILPIVSNICRRPKSAQLFIQSIVCCAFVSFLFGYHVHEKAVMTIILPFTMLAVSNAEYVTNFILLSGAGHLALFPLLYENGESPVKTLILILHLAYMITVFEKLHQKNYASGVPWMLVLKVFMLPALYALCLTGLSLSGLNMRLPFLHLVILSCLCSVCILYCWVNFSIKVFVEKQNIPFRPVKAKRK